jgi:hypothetical protein
MGPVFGRTRAGTIGCISWALQSAVLGATARPARNQRCRLPTARTTAVVAIMSKRRAVVRVIMHGIMPPAPARRRSHHPLPNRRCLMCRPFLGYRYCRTLPLLPDLSAVPSAPNAPPTPPVGAQPFHRRASSSQVPGATLFVRVGRCTRDACSTTRLRIRASMGFTRY